MINRKRNKENSSIKNTIARKSCINSRAIQAPAAAPAGGVVPYWREPQIKIRRAERVDAAILNSHKGNLAIKILSILVVAVITSILVLISVRTGIISVKAEHEPAEVLNMEFLPLRNSGNIDIKEFSFCSTVDEQFNCDPKTSFNFGGQVHFKYAVESTVLDGQVMVVKNYRIKSPSGQLLLDADSRDNFYVDVRSQKTTETVTFKDYFTLLGVSETGEYTLELIIENQLIGKRATLVKKFEVVG